MRTLKQKVDNQVTIGDPSVSCSKTHINNNRKHF